MPSSSRPLGVRSTPEIPIPQFSNWVTALRTTTADDTAVADVPEGECINLDKSTDRKGSRFPLNVISLAVKVSSGGAVTIQLFAREKDGAGNNHHYAATEPVSLTGSKVLVFKDLPPLKYVPLLSSVTGTIEVSGGGTL